jgi:hypothetical protein
MYKPAMVNIMKEIYSLKFYLSNFRKQSRSLNEINKLVRIRIEEKLKENMNITNHDNPPFDTLYNTHIKGLSEEDLKLDPIKAYVAVEQNIFQLVEENGENYFFRLVAFLDGCISGWLHFWMVAFLDGCISGWLHFWMVSFFPVNQNKI